MNKEKDIILKEIMNIRDAIYFAWLNQSIATYLGSIKQNSIIRAVSNSSSVQLCAPLCAPRESPAPPVTEAHRDPRDYDLHVHPRFPFSFLSKH